MTNEHHGYAQVDPEHGQIFSIRLPVGVIPVPGMNEDNTRINVIVTDQNLPNEQCLDFKYFINNYVYHQPSGTFQKTNGVAPNDHATWSFEDNDWDWDLEPVMKEIRHKRNGLLAHTDFVLLPDAPFTEAQVAEVLNYRQLLRNFPNTITGFPANSNQVVWPTVPNFL